MPLSAQQASACLTLILGLLPAQQLLAAPLVDAVNRGEYPSAHALLEQGVDVREAAVDGTTALHWAVYREQADLVEALLARGADPNQANDYGATPMSTAATHGNTRILAALLAAGGDVESPNGEGQTLLMAVARTGNVESARLLLEQGADVNRREQWGQQTALMWAASQRQPAMVELLLAHGAEVDTRSKQHDWPRPITSEPRIKPLETGGFTPLLYAAREGCQACIRALLAGGADINLSDPWGRTPLLMALLNLHYDSAALLMEAGADIHRWDWWGRTPLYVAIDLHLLPSSRRGDLPSQDRLNALDIARSLLEQGAYVNQRLKKEPPFRSDPGDRGYTDGSPDSRVLNAGATALHKAAMAGDVDAVRLLLAHGARVDIPNLVYEVTPIHSAAGIWRIYGIFFDTPITGEFKTGEQAAEIMQLLLEAGADIHTRAANGQNVAHGAAAAGWEAALQVAHAQGVDLQARDVGGFTPRDLAAAQGHSSTVELIDALLAQ